LNEIAPPRQLNRCASSNFAVKKTIFIISGVLVVIIGIIVVLNWGLVSMLVIGPYQGPVIESWETSGPTLQVRVDAHSEQNTFVPGAYYVFRSAPKDSNAWHDVMTFRHDDPVAIPRDSVRFVDDRTAFVFMGWMYAVTTDGGANWSVWDAGHDLPNWQCCNYGLITDVQLNADGTGTMALNPIKNRRGEVPLLRTKDFGRHWSV
jgi:hypothetical protein